VQKVVVRDDGPVRTITLADAKRRNALSRDLVAQLLDAFAAADADPDVRVVVVTNEGSTFCAGVDLAEREPDGGPPTAVRDPGRLFGHVARSPKPYVGRIAGHCVAGGMGLAASMDLSFAVDTARFGFTEVRIGVAAATIAVVCLPKLRPVDARALLLRGDRFDAAEAARLGLVTAAVGADELDREVQAAVDDLLLAGPGALAATKRVLAEVPALGVDEAFAAMAELSGRLFLSDEAAEGIAAFREKRRPAWAPPS
jgi:methylglutaconyl-CoA hydratase